MIDDDEDDDFDDPKYDKYDEDWDEEDDRIGEDTDFDEEEKPEPIIAEANTAPNAKKLPEVVLLRRVAFRCPECNCPNALMDEEPIELTDDEKIAYEVQTGRKFKMGTVFAMPAEVKCQHCLRLFYPTHVED